MLLKYPDLKNVNEFRRLNIPCDGFNELGETLKNLRRSTVFHPDKGFSQQVAVATGWGEDNKKAIQLINNAIDTILAVRTQDTLIKNHLVGYCNYTKNGGKYGIDYWVKSQPQQFFCHSIFILLLENPF